MKMFRSALVLAAVAGLHSAAQAQDDAGRQAFRVCAPCHQVGETARNLVGPQLNGIVGRKAGQISGFNYSDANKNSGLTWDDETLKAYLRNPREKMPGTRMAFVGIKNDADIDKVIAYLKSFGADGKPAK